VAFRRAITLIFLLGLVQALAAPVYGQTVINFPRIISNSSLFSGLAVGNPTKTDAAVTFTAYLPDGTLLSPSGAQNPTTLQIPAGGQAAKVFTDIFGAGNFNGWVQATSSTTGLTGFFLNGNNVLTDLDGAGAVAPIAQFVLPFASEDSAAQTEITIVNVNADAAAPTLTLYGFDGSVIATKTLTLPPHGLLRQTLTLLFGAIDLSNASHVGVSSDRPLIGHELVANFALPGASVRRETAALSGQQPTTSTTYVLPQFVTGGGWLSLIGIVNASGVGQQITLTAYKDDGTVWNLPNNPKRISLDGNASLRTTADQLFGFPSDSIQTGWLQVQSTLGYVGSYIGYGNTGTPSFAAVAGTDALSASQYQVFSQVAQGVGFFTGLTLVNPGAQPANLQFYTIRPDGTTVGGSSFTVQPNQRLGGLFSDLLPSSLTQVGGWAFLRSSQPVIGAVLFGTTNGDALANVPQQVPAGDFTPSSQTTAAIDGTVQAAGQAIGGVQLTLSGPVTATTSSDGFGHYVFPQLPAGTYVVTAAQPGAQFVPPQQTVTVARQNVDGVNFQAGGITPANAPSIQFISPTSTFAGNSALNIRVLGANFTPVSVIQANGQPIPTDFVSSSEVDGIVPPSQLTAAGTLQIAVVTSPPGGGVSAAVPLTVSPAPSNPLIQGFANVGSFPAGVAIDTTRNMALVTNQSSDSVTVLDLNSFALKTTITVGRSPAEGIAIHQAKNIALVANPGSDDVSVIDLTTSTQTQKIPVGHFPVGVAINSTTNKALVTNAYDNNVSIIDLNTLTVTGQIPVGTGPEGIAVNPATNQAVVTNSGSNDVWIIDLNSNNTLAKLPVGQFPRGVAINSTTNVAVVANANSNTVSVIDVTRRTVLSTLKVNTGPTGVGIHELTNTALITNSGVVSGSTNYSIPTTVSVLDLGAGTLEQDIPVGSAAFGIAINQGSQQAVVANFGSNNVTVINVPNPVPQVADVNPKTFPVGGGDFNIDVTGTGFVPTSVVTLNSQSLPTTFVSPTELKAIISAALMQQLLQAQASSIVQAGANTFAASQPTTFNVGVHSGLPGGGNSPPPKNPNAGQLTPQSSQPVLTSISPTQTTVGSGPVTLTLNGNNFSGLSQISFAGTTLSPSSSSPTSMTVTIPANLLTAGTYPVSVTNLPPGGGTSDSRPFLVNGQSNPVPHVSTVNPTSIAAGSGPVTVTVSGTGFVPTTTGNLGSASGVVSGSSMTFALTANDTQHSGTLNGTISNGPGGSASFSVSVVNPTPTVTGFNPASATAGSPPVAITVSGTSFVSGSQITIEGTPIPATTFDPANPGQLSGNIPASYLARSGNVHIGAFNPSPGGGSAAGSTTFTITSARPELTGVSPATTTVLDVPADVTVQLTGSGFAGNSTVQANGTSLTPVYNSSTSLTVTLPASMLGLGTTIGITVSNPAPGGGTSPPVTFTANNPAPNISGVTPATISGDQTNVVLTVTGSHFVRTSTINVGTLSLTTTYVSSTQLTAPLPQPLPLGRQTVTVITSTPGGGTSTGFPIEISSLTPSITAVTPNPAVPGQPITVTGNHFGPGSTVLLNGQPLPTSVTSAAALTALIAAPRDAASAALTATIPATTQPGPANVAVQNPATSTTPAQTSDSTPIQINNPGPSITSLDPSTANGQGGQTITVHGSGFVPTSQVRVNGTGVTTNFIDAGTLSFTLPALPGATSASVQVFNPAPGGGGSGTLSLTLTFPAPTLGALSPTSGTAGNSVFVAITGTNFVQGAGVTFGSSDVAATFVSSTEIDATFVLTTAGIFPVTVTNPGGSTSNPLLFTVNPAITTPLPALTQISPNTGAVGAAFSVTLTGAYLSGVSAITLTGTGATGVLVTNVASPSSTTATATFSIASNATPGPINVTATTPGGTSNAVTFTILGSQGPPSASISPIGGTQGQGSVPITLTGLNLTGTTAIQFFTMSPSANDPGVTVTGVNVNGTGTQVTATANVSGSALPGFHTVQITRNGQAFFVGGSFEIYPSGSPAVYTFTPTQGAIGSTVGISATGALLNNVTGLTLYPQSFGVDSGISVSGLNVSATTLTANLTIGNGAMIGPHIVNLNSNTGGYGTNVTFYVTSSIGVGVTGASAFSITRGSTATPFTVFGSNLGTVTGIEFFNPDGTPDPLITSSGFTASGSSVAANLTLDPNMPIGERRVILDFAGGVQVFTTLAVTVQTQASQGSIYLTSFGPQIGAAGQSFAATLFGGGLTGISGFKFQVNGVDDSFTHVTGFQAPSSGQASATISVDSNATLGPRTLVLLPTAGGTLTTNLTLTVVQGLPSFSISPVGALTGQSNVAITLTGTNLAGTTGIQFLASGVNDPGITVSNVTVSTDGTQVTATINVSGNAIVGTDLVEITRNGQTLFGGETLFTIYTAGTPALYSVSPAQGAIGTTVGLTITGDTLTNVNGLVFYPLTIGSDSDSFSVSGLTTSASSAAANVTIGTSALVGPHLIEMQLSSSPYVVFTSAFFNVTTSGGTTVTNLSPSLIPRGNTATSFTISGANLGAVTGLTFYNPDHTAESLITIGGFTASPTSITGNLTLDPNMSVGPRVVALNFAGGVQAFTTLVLYVEAQASQGNVYVNGFFPTRGSPGGSFNASLGGGNLSALSGFKFQVNGTDDTTLHVTGFQSSTGAATVSIDSNATLGPRQIVLLPAGGGSIATNLLFNVVPAPPSITSITPSTGVQGTTVNATISGTNLAGATSVNFVGAGVTASIGSGGTSTSLPVNIAIASNAGTGQYSFTVTAASGTSGVFNSFSVTGPIISQVSPNSGMQGVNSLSLTITGIGTHFTSQLPSVNFTGGITVVQVTVNSDTSLTAVVNISPSATLGLQNLLVTTGAESATGANVFTVNSPSPVVSSAIPVNGTQNSTLNVTVAGSLTHFAQGTTTATFGAGITVNSVTVTNSTTATVNITISPTATPGPRTVTMTTGAEVASEAGGFTVLVGLPQITNVSPGTGAQGASLSLTITGLVTNFQANVSQVTFSGAGVNVTQVVVNSPTQLTAQVTIASNAAPGARTVTVTTNGEVASQTGGFTVVPGFPAIVQIISNVGTPNNANQTETITGQLTNFISGTTQVSFGPGISVNGGPLGGYGTVVQVASTTSMTLTILVDSAATLGPRDVTVQTNSQILTVNNGFTVQSATPSTPFIVTTSPADESNGVPINTSYRVTFSGPIDRTTVSSSNVNISPNCESATNAVPGTLSVDASGRILTFTPASVLGVGQSYYFNFNITSPYVTDPSGHTLSARCFNFTTGFASDNSGPSFTGSNIADQDTGVGTNAPLIIGFNKPVDPSTQPAGLVVLQGTTPVAGVWGWNSNGPQATFTPTNGFVPNTTYVASYTASLTDSAGNALTNPGTITFTTGAGTDTTGLTLASYTPPNGFTTGRLPAIRVVFNKLIDPLSATTTSVYAYRSTNNGTPYTTVLNTTVTVSPDRKAVTLNLPGPLDVSTTYYWITCSIHDQAHYSGYCASWYFNTNSGVDVTPPAVIAVAPPDGATNVPVNAPIQILLSKPIDPTLVNSTSLTLSPAVSGTVSLATDYVTMTFTPASNLASNTTYMIHASGFKDLSGNAVTAFSTTSGFRTIDSSVPDTTNGTITQTPAEGTVGTNTSVVFTLSKRANPISVNTTSVRLYDNTSNTFITGSVTLDSTFTQITFTPTLALQGNHQYCGYAGVYTNIYDWAGNPFNYIYYYCFMTSAGTDTTPPTVVSVTPVDTATGIGPANPVTVTFSKPMNPGTLSSVNLAMFVGTNLYSQNFSSSFDSTSITFNTGYLNYGTTYTVVVTPDVTDLAGNHLAAEFRSSFTTAPQPSTTSPQVTVQRPASGATQVALNATISLFVSAPLNPSTVNSSSLRVSQNGTLIAGSISLIDNNQVVVFTPAAALTPGAIIRVFFTNAATDTSGNPLYNYQGSFTAAPDLSSTAPALTATSPCAHCSNVPRSVIIEAQFSKPLNPSTANIGNFYLQDCNSNPINGTVSIRSNNTVLRFTPSALPPANCSYFYVYLTNGITDVNNLAFSGASWYNYYNSTVDATSPAVSLVTPTNNAANIGVNATISMIFSKAINPLSVDSTSITVMSNNVAIPVNITFDVTNTSVTMTPQAPLPASSQVTVSVTANVHDASGNAATPFSFAFNTAAGPDFSRPLVISSTVANGQTNVPVTSVFTLTYNKPINTRTVTLNNTIYLYDTVFGYVTATLSFGGNGTQITLQPNALLAVNRSYYLSSCAVQDLNGNQANCTTYSFTTALTSPTGGPQVAFALPLNGAAQVPTNFQPQIQFDRAIDPSSLGSITLVRATSAGTVSVAFTSSLGVGTTVVTLLPATLLIPNSSYTLTITGVKDPAGNVMSGTVVRNFSTAASFDLVSPGIPLVGSSFDNASVYAVSPQGSTLTGTHPVIRFRFTKPVNSLKNYGGYLYNSTSNQYVSGTVVNFAADLMSAALSYPGNLDPNTIYCYYAGTLYDLAGNSASGPSNCFTTTSGLDSTAPVISLSSPPIGTTNVPVNARIVVKANKPIDATTITATSLTLTPAAPAGTTVQLASDYQTIYLTLGANLTAATAYTINASGVTDSNGNALTAFTSSFTTGSTTDTTSGTITLASPTQGSTNVPTTTSIVAQFSKRLNPASVGPNSFLVYAPGNEAIAGAVTVTTSITTSGLTFTPTAPLPANTTITVYVGYNGPISDYAGNTFNSLYNATFTTGSGTSTTAPTVSMTPAPGSTGVGPNAVVTLTFSESIDPSTINSQNFSLFNGSVSLNPYISASTDDRTVSLTGISLPYGATITAVVSTAVTDLFGNHLANPFQGSFTTISQPLSSNPSVVQSRPASGATGVPLNNPITLFASSPLNPSTAAGAFYVSQNGVLINGTVATSADGLSVVFTPSASYLAGASLQVFFNGATDTAGNLFQNYSTSFRTAPNLSTTAATMTSSIPPAYSGGNYLNTLIELQFNKAINTATLNSSNFYVQTSSSTNVAGTISTFNNNTSLRFTPSASLASGATYYVTWGTSGLQDSDGLAIAQGSFYFNTGSATDNSTPSVTSTTPAQGSTGIGSNAVVRFTFSKAMDAMSINTSSVALTQGGQPVPYSMNISGSPTSVILTPQVPFTGSTTITLALTGSIQDSVGHHLTPTTLTFQTASSADFSAPRVVRTSIDGSPAPAVPANTTTFSVVFNKPLDPTTVTSNGYFLYDTSIGPVATTTSVSSDGLTVTVTATSGLTVGHSYYVTAYYATDLNGNLQTNYNTRVFTVVASDTVAPLVSSTNPATNATGVPVNVLLELQFNKPVRATSLSQITLMRQVPNSSPVAVNFTPQMLYGATVVQLVPATVLLPNTTYTVSASGVQSIAGVAMTASYSFSFTTGNNPLRTSTPNVVSATASGVTLVNNAIAQFQVSLTPSFVITLDAPVEPGSINNGGVVLLLDSNLSTPLPLTFSLSADQMTITATTPSSLAASTIYHLRVSYSASLRDLAGNTGNAYYDYSFQTFSP
jgi:YVTN family beta-propeller protein